MLHIHTFTFNPFSENTYLLYKDNGACVIIDPGFYTATETQIFDQFISQHQLQPQLLLLTHAHLDHIFGLPDVVRKYHLTPHLHPLDYELLIHAPVSANMFGVSLEAYQGEINFIEHNTNIDFEGLIVNALHTAGHSPGSLSYYISEHNILLSGDVLFQESIGRTDLYKGNATQLKASIKNVLYSLPDDTIVYSGHGDATTIGHEKKNNPYVR